jgi:rubredoxin
MTQAAKTSWDCQSCGYTYDPAVGAPGDGIPSGTAFEDLPDAWTCPKCGVHMGNFGPQEK